MGTIRFVPSESPWVEPAPGYRKRGLHPGDDGHPELFELEVEPDSVTSAHAHDADEIIYVLAGALRFGAHDYGPGSSIMVAARTLYSFRAGPDGCRFLNFRPHRVPVIPKEELLASREGDPT